MLCSVMASPGRSESTPGPFCSGRPGPPCSALFLATFAPRPAGVLLGERGGREREKRAGGERGGDKLAAIIDHDFFPKKFARRPHPTVAAREGG